MVFAIHQHESATGMYVHPSNLNPCPTSSPHIPQSTSFGCPASCIKLALVMYFTYGNIHVSMLFSQITPPSPSPTESKSLFFTSVSPLLPDTWDCWSHLSKSHIYVLVYSICLSLTEVSQKVLAF